MSTTTTTVYLSDVIEHTSSAAEAVPGSVQFVAPMQSVVYTPVTALGRSRATVVQRPPNSLFGEATGVLSPWVMPAFTYDLLAARSSEYGDDQRLVQAGIMADSINRLGVGSQVRIGGTDMNQIVATVLEVQTVDELVNHTGSCLALGTFVDESPINNITPHPFLNAAPPPGASSPHAIGALLTPDTPFMTFERIVDDNLKPAYTEYSTGATRVFLDNNTEARWYADFDRVKNQMPGFVKWFMYTPMPPYLVTGHTLDFTPRDGQPLEEAQAFDLLGAETSGTNPTWMFRLQALDLEKEKAYDKVFRLSVPVDLNSFTPSYMTQRQAQFGTQIYAIDATTGLANTLLAPPSTVTLASRGQAWRMTPTDVYYERFYWPMYVLRSGEAAVAGGTTSTSGRLSVQLQNLQQRPVRIALRAFAFHGPIAEDQLVLKIDGVRGTVVSNNPTANTAFAVLSTSLPSTRGDISTALAVTADRSDMRVLAEAPIDQTLRTITARFYTLQGQEVQAPVSLWLDLTLKGIF
jgi:hypothetical protein